MLNHKSLPPLSSNFWIQVAIPSSSALKTRGEELVGRNTPSSARPFTWLVDYGVLTIIAVWILTVAMVAVMIYELVRNDQEQGSPISTKPVFNPLIGPSQSALINFGIIQCFLFRYASLIISSGARYPPC